ncbi:MAG: carbohydrate kinase [Gammaproteobacteria bacterium]
MYNNKITESHRRPIIFGEVLFDHFPDGSRVLGGAPFNVAWHLQGFGLFPILISRVGEDSEANDILSIMSSWHMDTNGIQIDGHYPTGAVNITLEDGQPTFSIVPDQAYDFIEYNTMLERLAEQHMSLLYHGSLASRQPQSRETLARLKSRIAGRIFVDINLREPWWSATSAKLLLRDAQWVKLNEEELQRLTNQLSGNESQLNEIANKFYKTFDLQLLIVTQGDAGARIYSSGNCIQGKPVAVDELSDTVGAGDAFSAVILLGLHKGWPLERTLNYALQFASAVCGVRGATIDDRKVYQHYLEQWEKE